MPKHATKLPNMHTKRHPNLFTKPPTIGPDMKATPESREPTKEIDLLLESKYSTNGGKMTPKQYSMPTKRKNILFFK